MEGFMLDKHIVEHRRAYKKVEKELLGRNTYRSFFHDLDKLFLLLIFSRRVVRRIHRCFSFHHPDNIWGFLDVKAAIIDWECARYTKIDKPLNARQTLYIYFPHLIYKVEPELFKLGL
jgi:hypothetical protein